MSPAVTISCRLPRSHESENAPRFFSIVLETPVYPRISPTYNLFVFKILPWLLAVLFFHLVFEAWGFSFKCLVSPPTLHFRPAPFSYRLFPLTVSESWSSLHHSRSAHLVTVWTPLPTL